MLDLYTIQIYKLEKIPNEVFKYDFNLILDTQMILDLTNSTTEKIIKVIKDIFNSESDNICISNETFCVYINTNYMSSDAKHGIKFIIEYKDCEIIKIERESMYFKELENLDLILN